MKYKFTVPGRAVPKSRPRMGKGRVYTPKRTKDYEKKVYAYALQAGVKKNQGLVRMEIKFFLKNIMSLDIDNAVKAILDAGNGTFYLDDKQVITLFAQKLPAKHEETEITIEDE